MNWITTNIRLPEGLYMELKMKAAKERKSVAAVIREKLETKEAVTQDDAKKLLATMVELGDKTAKENKGINFTEGLIGMRYEQ
jgi:plasmid stability protein